MTDNVKSIAVGGRGFEDEVTQGLHPHLCRVTGRLQRDIDVAINSNCVP